MGLRGPKKQFNSEIRVDLTDAQLLHLRMRAVAANDSVAAVLRELVNKDRKETEEEIANAG
jgi:hypothetical protein